MRILLPLLLIFSFLVGKAQDSCKEDLHHEESKKQQKKNRVLEALNPKGCNHPSSHPTQKTQTQEKLKQLLNP